MHTSTGDRDFTPLQSKGVQHLPNFFPDGLKADFARRAEEIIAARSSGALTSHDQDSQGFPHEWFEPLLRHPALVALAVSLLGPNVCGSGWRILAKDRHFKGAIHIHQDWGYNPGHPDKITIFVPLTRVNKANGGLVFLERSHLIGPVSRGPLDPSRFPAMNEVCPDIDVGDILLCDFLTWHYSDKPENTDERIMLQLNYQPASDASSKNLVAGEMPHEFELMSRFDASAAPSVELNAAIAREHYARGNIDKATRYARGLLVDDPEHAGAALLLYDILAAANDPTALTYLEQSRSAVAKLQSQISERDLAFGRKAHQPAVLAATREADPANSPWRPLPMSWRLKESAGEPDPSALPLSISTPELAWDYGAIGYPVSGARAATIRVRAEAVSGKVGILLLTEDCSAEASEEHVIAPGSGETTIMIAVKPELAPARLVLRNYGEQGVAARVTVSSVDIAEVS